jgi:hypothetical protein
MVVIPDPVVIIPPGKLAPVTHVKLYKGYTPHVGKYLNESMTARDGSASMIARGVSVGTEVCVVGLRERGDRKVVIRAKAGEEGKGPAEKVPESPPSASYSGAVPPEDEEAWKRSEAAKKAAATRAAKKAAEKK